MKMSESLTTCKDKIESLLIKYPETRDSDKLLFFAFLVEFHDLEMNIGRTACEVFRGILMDEETPSMETVRRIRQKFQEEGHYCGEKRKERLEEEVEVRKVITDGIESKSC